MTPLVPVRVMVTDAWDEVPLQLPAQRHAGRAQAAGARGHPGHPRPSGYLVKYRGAELATTSRWPRRAWSRTRGSSFSPASAGRSGRRNGGFPVRRPRAGAGRRGAPPAGRRGPAGAGHLGPPPGWRSRAGRCWPARGWCCGPGSASGAGSRRSPPHAASSGPTPRRSAGSRGAGRDSGLHPSRLPASRSRSRPSRNPRAAPGAARTGAARRHRRRDRRCRARRWTPCSRCIPSPTSEPRGDERAGRRRALPRHHSQRRELGGRASAPPARLLAAVDHAHAGRRQRLRRGPPAGPSCARRPGDGLLPGQQRGRRRPARAAARGASGC